MIKTSGVVPKEGIKRSINYGMNANVRLQICYLAAMHNEGASNMGLVLILNRECSK
jgi:hypothetical protein